MLFFQLFNLQMAVKKCVKIASLKCCKCLFSDFSEILHLRKFLIQVCEQNCQNIMFEQSETLISMAMRIYF